MQKEIENGIDRSVWVFATHTVCMLVEDTHMEIIILEYRLHTDIEPIPFMFHSLVYLFLLRVLRKD